MELGVIHGGGVKMVLMDAGAENSTKTGTDGCNFS